MEIDTQLFNPRKAAADTFTYIICGALPQILNFILLPLYSRLLTPRDFGILGYISSLAVFVTIINSLSLNSYYLRHYFESGDKKTLSGTIFYFLIVNNLVFICLEGILLKTIFHRFGFKVPFSPYMVLGLSECFFSSFNIVPLRYYRLEFKTARYLAISLIQLALLQSLGLGFIYFLKMGADGKLLANVITSGIFAIFYLSSSRRYARLTIDIPLLKRALAFSFPLLFGAYAAIILNISDRMILERFVPLSSLGIYSIAYAIASVASILTNSFSFVIEPMVYKAASSPTFMSDYLRLKTYYYFFVFLITSFIIIFSKETIALLLPKAYAEASGLVSIMALSYIFVAAHSNYGQLLMLKNKTVAITAVTSIGAASSILLNLILIPLYGIYASAATIVVSYLFMAIIAFGVLFKETKATFEARKDIISLAALVIILCGVFAINPVTFPNRVIIKIFISALFTSFLLKQYSVKLSGLRQMIPSFGMVWNFILERI